MISGVAAATFTKPSCIDENLLMAGIGTLLVHFIVPLTPASMKRRKTLPKPGKGEEKGNPGRGDGVRKYREIIAFF
jgi:hypothetical protein